MGRRGLFLCFAVIVVMSYSAIANAGSSGKLGLWTPGWTEFQTNDNVAPATGGMEDWVYGGGSVGPGVGGQNFDAEYLLAKISGTTLSIGLQTGFDLVDGNFGSYYAGDIALSFDNDDSTYEYALDLGHLTKNYSGIKVDAGSGTGTDTAGLYSVTSWDTDVYYGASNPFAMDGGSLVSALSVTTGSDPVTDGTSYFAWADIDISGFLDDWGSGSAVDLQVSAHWTMSCGNDEINGSLLLLEPGEIVVPEPGTIALLGLGLAGLIGAGVRRKRLRNS